jgi:hypothetical protein
LLVEIIPELRARRVECQQFAVGVDYHLLKEEGNRAFALSPGERVSRYRRFHQPERDG